MLFRSIDEARRLGIPVVAVVDSNSDPAGIAFPIPGNDDASRAINLYCELVSQAVLDGIRTEMEQSEAGEGAAAPAAEGGEQPAEEPRRGKGRGRGGRGGRGKQDEGAGAAEAR